ncbi:MAG: T9SS type A sorting domain-containing protein [Ignavibacteria bacterium]
MEIESYSISRLRVFLFILMMLSAKNISAQEINPYEFEYNATITARLQLNGSDYDTEDASILAYSGSELRGRIDAGQDIQGHKVYFLMVYLRNTSEEIEFKISGLPNTSKAVPIRNKITLSADDVIGSPNSPQILNADIELSGKVTENGNGKNGVTIDFGDGTTILTGNGGKFTRKVEPGWSGNITAQKGCYTLTPTIGYPITNIDEDKTDIDFTAQKDLVTISGKVTDRNGQGVIGVNINLTNNGGTTTTNSNGEYSIAVECGWSGDIYAEKDGYTITPTEDHEVENLTEDIIDVDFYAELIYYTISGIVTKNGLGLEGVLIEYNGGSTETDANGNYSFTVKYGVSGTITATKDCYNITPLEIPYSNVTGNIIGQNFEAEYLYYEVSGEIKDTYNNPIANVTINCSYSSVTAKTDANGYYSILLPCNWSGLITVSKTNFEFTPSQIEITELKENSGNNDFTGRSLLKIYGYVYDEITSEPLEDIGIYFRSDENHSFYTYTNSEGYYEKEVSEGWSGEVEPLKEGYRFQPLKRKFNNFSTSYRLDFGAQKIQREISGYIFNIHKKPLPDVDITYSNGEGVVKTDSNGFYTNEVDYGWSGTVTPSLSDYTFTPVNYSYTNVSTYEYFDQNFEAEGTIKDLFVGPTFTYLPAIGGTSKIVVENKGNAHMNWNASITQGTDWIRIDSGAVGLNNGIIYISYDPIVGTERSGSITVTADGALNSPQTINLPQEFGFGNEVFNTALDGSENDLYGTSLGRWGDYIVIGASGDDDSKGSAYICKKVGPIWSFQQKIYAADGQPGDYFGYSVDIDSNYIVVGAYGDDIYTGSIYVYKRTNETWIQAAKLTASDKANNDQLGYSVSISGNYIIAGAHGENTLGNSSGAAYFFEKPASGWTDSTENQKILINDGSAGDSFGLSVALHNDIAVISAPSKSLNSYNVGAVYLFKYSSNLWSEVSKILPDENFQNSYFGWNCDINKENFVINSEGYSYIYAYDNINYNLDAKVKPIDGNIYHWSDISITKSFVAVSGRKFSETSTCVYIFKRELESSSNWHHYSTVIPSGNIHNDFANKSVLIYGTNLMVGAPSHENDKGRLYSYNAPYFNGPGQTYTISGTIINSSNQQPIENVVVNFTNGVSSSITDASGNYGTEVEYGWSGTAAPFKEGFNFTPIKLEFNNVVSNLTNQNFSGTAPTAIIILDPTIHYVPVSSGSITISISNTGSGMMNWVSQIDSSDNWLSIVSDTLGIDNDTITVNFDSFAGDQRTGKIIVSSPDALNNPQYAEIRQISESANIFNFAPLDAAQDDEFGSSLAVSDSFAVIGAPNDDDKGSASGSVYVLKKGTDDTWTQYQKLVPDDLTNGNRFGYSIDMNSHYIIVGTSANCAYIYKLNNNIWELQSKLTATFTDQNAFGTSVAISDNFLVVGDPYLNVSGLLRGAISFFKNNGNSWDFHEGIIAPDGKTQFGRVIKISGNYIIVSENNSAYIYKFDGQNFVENAVLSETNVQYFAYGLSIDGNYAFCHALPGGEDYEKVYVYKKDSNDNWTLFQTINNPQGPNLSYSQFGYTISSEGNNLLISDMNMNLSPRKVYIYKFVNNQWTLKQTFSNNSGNANQFGRYIDVDNKTVLVGAPRDHYEENNIYFCGTSYFYNIYSDISPLQKSGAALVRDVNNIKEIPTEFALYQNYPNPFNPITTINFDLPEKSFVSLVIYNILGERVVELTNGELNAGYHKVSFDASRFSSGIYIYRIIANDFVDTKKMILLK